MSLHLIFYVTFLTYFERGALHLYIVIKIIFLLQKITTLWRVAHDRGKRIKKPEKRLLQCGFIYAHR